MLFGLTAAQWAVVIPRVLAVVKFIIALIIGYSVLNRVSYFQTMCMFLDWLEGELPGVKSPKDWTQEETQRWWDRATGDAGGG